MFGKGKFFVVLIASLIMCNMYSGIFYHHQIFLKCMDHIIHICNIFCKSGTVTLSACSTVCSIAPWSNFGPPSSVVCTISVVVLMQIVYS